MKRAALLGGLAAANVIFAFIVQWYVITRLGPGIATDALFAGMTLPQLTLVVISGSLTRVLIPLLTGESADRQRHNAWGFLLLIGGVFSLLAGALHLSAPWWVPLTVPGFSAEGQELTIELTRVQLVGMVFTAINGVQSAVYFARHRFVWPEVVLIVATLLGLLLMIWVLPLHGVVAVAWVNTLRIVLQTVLLAPGMGRPVWPHLRDQTLSDAWHRIKPLLLGNTYSKTGPLVDRFLLSNSVSGSLSLYYLAQQIFTAITEVIYKSIVNPLMPRLGGLHKNLELIEFRCAYRRAMLEVSVISVGGFLILVFGGKMILALMFSYGRFSGDDLHALWLIMVLMAGQLVIGNISGVMMSVFYAIGDTRAPTMAGMIAYTIGVPIKLGMYYCFNVQGLAFGVSIYYVISLFILKRALSKKNCT